MINGETMFILDKTKFGDCDFANAKEFVEFWKQYYPEDTTKIFRSKDNILIDYITELNLGMNLNPENIKRLLRWKDPRWLTEIKPSGDDNPNVRKVLNELNIINDFRHNRINEKEFSRILSEKKIFQEGLIYRVFLFHMAQPNEYPIADKNIFRAFFILNNKNRNPEDTNDKDYEEYTKFFFKIAKHAGISPETDISKYIRKLKDIDNALFAYGQFLESYDKI